MQSGRDSEESGLLSSSINPLITPIVLPYMVVSQIGGNSNIDPKILELP